jgi:hypothetical protein
MKFRYNNRIENKDSILGNINIDISKIKKLKIGEKYFVKYNDSSLKENLNKYFLATLNEQKYYSYIFSNIYMFNDNKNIIKKYNLSTPVYWLETFEISKLFPKIPLEIIIYEIMTYI